MNLNKIKITFLIAILFLSFSGLGYCLEKPINVDINDSTWLPVSLYDGTDAKDYIFQSRNDTVFFITDSVESGLAGIFWTVKEGSGLSIGEIMALRGGLLFYAKTPIGTDVVELLRIKYRSDL